MRWIVLSLLLCVAAAPATKPVIDALDRATLDRQIKEAADNVGNLRAQIVAKVERTQLYTAAQKRADEAKARLEAARENGTIEERAAASSDYIAAKAAPQKIVDACLAADAELAEAIDTLKQLNHKKAGIEARETAAREAAQEKAHQEQRVREALNKLTSVKYDRFKDLTTISTTACPLLGGQGETQIVFGVAYAGQTQKSPAQKVEMALFSNSRGWRFLREKQIIFLVDGKRHELEVVDRDDDIKLGGVSESLLFSLPADLYNQMLFAQKVEFQLGQEEFKLPTEAQKLAALLKLRASIDNGKSAQEKAPAK